jgi:hypothetical protein
LNKTYEMRNKLCENTIPQIQVQMKWTATTKCFSPKQVRVYTRDETLTKGKRIKKGEVVVIVVTIVV